MVRGAQHASALVQEEGGESGRQKQRSLTGRLEVKPSGNVIAEIYSDPDVLPFLTLAGKQKKILRK